MSSQRAPALPPYAHVVRGLRGGTHPLLALLPRAAESPAMKRIGTLEIPVAELLAETVVDIEPGDGYVYVDVGQPAIVLREGYYRHGSDLVLYLDLLHENPDAYATVLGDEIADTVFTDPPYNVNYANSAKDQDARQGSCNPQRQPWRRVL